MQAIQIIFFLLSVVIASIVATNYIADLFTFSVPLVPKKENNIPLYVMIAVDVILLIIIFFNY
jgi:hypothetical protein